MPPLNSSSRLRYVAASCLLAVLAACSREAATTPAAAAPATRTTADSSGGAISTAPLDKPAPKPTPEDVLAGTQWPSATLGEGEAGISCSADYAAGDGE